MLTSENSLQLLHSNAEEAEAYRTPRDIKSEHDVQLVGQSAPGPPRRESLLHAKGTLPVELAPAPVGHSSERGQEVPGQAELEGPSGRRLVSFNDVEDVVTDQNRRLTSPSCRANEAKLKMLKNNIQQANTQRNQLIQVNAGGSDSTPARSASPARSILSSDRKMHQSVRSNSAKKSKRHDTSLNAVPSRRSILNFDDNRSLGSHCLVQGVVHGDKFLTKKNKLKSEENCKFFQSVQRGSAGLRRSSQLSRPSQSPSEHSPGSSRPSRVIHKDHSPQSSEKAPSVHSMSLGLRRQGS